MKTISRDNGAVALLLVLNGTWPHVHYHSKTGNVRLWHVDNEGGCFFFFVSDCQLMFLTSTSSSSEYCIIENNVYSRGSMTTAISLINAVCIFSFLRRLWQITDSTDRPFNSVINVLFCPPHEFLTIPSSSTVSCWFWLLISTQIVHPYNSATVNISSYLYCNPVCEIEQSPHDTSGLFVRCTWTTCTTWDSGLFAPNVPVGCL